MVDELDESYHLSSSKEGDFDDGQLDFLPNSCKVPGAKECSVNEGCIKEV